MEYSQRNGIFLFGILHDKAVFHAHCFEFFNFFWAAAPDSSLGI